MNYCEYSATKIMGFVTMGDGSWGSIRSDIHPSRYNPWHPDTDRNQLWLVMNQSLVFDTEWIARAVRLIHSNSNYPDDAAHQHHYANWVTDRDKDTNWNELCKWAITLPSVALAAICKAHMTQEAK